MDFDYLQMRGSTLGSSYVRYKYKRQRVPVPVPVSVEEKEKENENENATKTKEEERVQNPSDKGEEKAVVDDGSASGEITDAHQEEPTASPSGKSGSSAERSVDVESTPTEIHASESVRSDEREDSSEHSGESDERGSAELEKPGSDGRETSRNEDSGEQNSVPVGSDNQSDGAREAKPDANG